MHFTSKLIEDAVDAFATLPGIGRKTAVRLVLHLLNKEPQSTDLFVTAIQKMRSEIQFCKQCGNVSDAPVCVICNNPQRDNKIICVVETIRDLLAIENTQQYRGTYHVLGGVISPMEGIGPNDLQIATLLDRIHKDDVEELIMALNPTMEGDTTAFYISRQLASRPLRITTLARGVSFGNDLEYTDDLTLARSLATRTTYENYLVNKQ